MANKKFDRLGFIMDFECGECTDEEIIDGFQHMINDGTAWRLQGCYGRTAHALILNGYCTQPAEQLDDNNQVIPV